ncbi:MAG: hypothetical protein VYA66_09200 [SAR324 cluster bacterium]|nr:hypothetical protein [SAR324 cluster bacterium]
MAKIFKPKIIWIFYRIEVDVLVFFQRFLKILFFFSASVVFFGEYVENVKAFAKGEELKKCEKLKDPSTVLELQEFRFCLKELNLERRGGKEIEIIKRSYKGSLELTKKLNMMSDNKSSKKLKDEL